MVGIQQVLVVIMKLWMMNQIFCMSIIINSIILTMWVKIIIDLMAWLERERELILIISRFQAKKIMAHQLENSNFFLMKLGEGRVKFLTQSSHKMALTTRLLTLSTLFFGL